MLKPDYNYHNSPDFLQHMLDTVGGMPTILTFCQLNHVYVEPTSDLQYGCVINYKSGEPFSGYWAVEMDSLSALVRGVITYVQHEADKVATKSRVEQFAERFYKEHGKAMSILSHED